VLDTASGQRDTNYEARIDDSGYIEVVYSSETTPSDVVYRMPFAGDTDTQVFLRTPTWNGCIQPTFPIQKLYNTQPFLHGRSSCDDSRPQHP
jgi:hypothetical protein